MTSTDRSISELLASLEAQAAEHERQEAHHAEQEVFHRERRSAHAAELEQIRRHLEALRVAVATLDRADLSASVPEPDDEDLGPASRPRVAKMVEKVVESKRPGERFGCEALTAEVNRRFGDRLRQRIEEPQISVVLRRLAQKKRIELVRRGRPHQEALYSLAEGNPAR
jgi:hypothetical protein